jgi:nucleotide-binding universal stress UspA family protein
LHELRALAEEVGRDSSIPVEAQVLHGNPSIEILAEASQRNASLILLGSTQRKALENLTRDRTVYKVLAHARCPVMTLREAVLAGAAEAAGRLAVHS